MTDLAALRAELDEVDRSLVALVARRLRVVGEVAQAKARSSAPVRDPEREREVLDRVARSAVEQGAPPELVRRLFRDLIGTAVDQQSAQLLHGSARPLTVAHPGGEHGQGHLAAVRHAAGRGWTATCTGYPHYADVVDALTSGAADLAVLPVESTRSGSTDAVYDLLLRAAGTVSVVGEQTLLVDPCLAAPSVVPLARLRTVVGEPSALEACAGVLRGLRAELVPVPGSGDAARAVAAAGDPGQAALDSAEAAEAAGLVVLARGVADVADEHTRYLVLAREPAPVPERVPAKTSLVLTLGHQGGALLGCLQVLAEHGHSLTKLESRPVPGRPFEYLFFVDVEGAVGGGAEGRHQGGALLDALRATVLDLTVLGSYPAAVLAADR